MKQSSINTVGIFFILARITETPEIIGTIIGFIFLVMCIMGLFEGTD